MTSTFLAACRREPVEHTPVWFMRQAGRYQESYRAVRRRLSLLEICERPDVCMEVTLRPVQELGVDAAILFSDIMVPLRAVGVDLDIVEGVGPVVRDPVRDASGVAALRPLEPEADLPHVLQTVRMLRAELRGTPLIGFAGGPFTLASYLVEGGPTRQYLRVKGMMWEQPQLFAALLERLADIVLALLRAQVEHGAQAVQIFDSWAGALSPQDFRAVLLPVLRRLFAGLGDLGVPRIYFGVGTAGILRSIGEIGADVVGVDWRIDLGQAWDAVGSSHALQGNLDPVAVLAPEDTRRAQVRAVLDAAHGRAGHIFNLGHGVLPQSSPDALRQIVEQVHARAV